MHHIQRCPKCGETSVDQGSEKASHHQWLTNHLLWHILQVLEAEAD